jgi:RHS repeat-associated protein
MTAGNSAAKIAALTVAAVLVVVIGVARHRDHQARTGAGSLAWRVAYDDAGRISQRIDPAGRVTRLAYGEPDAAGLSTVVATPPDGEAPVTWQVDRQGRLAAMDDGEGRSRFHYDSGDRLTAVDRSDQPSVRYGYDGDGRVRELAVGEDYRLSWRYDCQGRPLRLSTPAGEVSYEYNDAEREVTRHLPCGLLTIWRRAADGQLESLVHGRTAPGDSHRYTELAGYTYHYGADGRVASVAERCAQGSVERRYHYDPMGRLTSVEGSDHHAWHYTYDKLGNRLRAAASGRPEQVCTYDWLGRLATVDGRPCHYDACGNLTEVTLDGGRRAFTYHADGRLASAGSVSFGYDGKGRLVRRHGADGDTAIVPDPRAGEWHPLVITGPGEGRTLVVWDGEVPLALVRGGQVQWLLTDRLGSVRAVTDGHGAVVAQQDYDPFGAGPAAADGAALAPGFAGLFGDAAAGVQLTRARAYVPGLGVFLQPDPQKRVPSACPTDLGPFVYCGSDPVNWRDASGLQQNAADPYWPGGWSEPGEPGEPISDDGDDGPIKGAMVGPGVDLGLEAGKLAPGRIGAAAEFGQLGWGGWGAMSSWNDWGAAHHDHPGDPLNDLRFGSALLSTVAFFGQPELGPWGGATASLEVARAAASEARAQVLLNRSENLLNFGGAVLPSGASVSQIRDEYTGYFSIHGPGYSGYGGYLYGDSSHGLFQHDPTSWAYAHTDVQDLRTRQGQWLSGQFSQAEHQVEQGGNFWNGYDPTSTTTTRYRHEQYHISTHGGMSMSGDTPPPPSAPQIPVGDVKPQQPDELKKVKPSVFPPPPGPPSWLPAVGGGGGRWQSAAASAVGGNQPPPPPPPPAPVGGVYLGGAGASLDGVGLVSGLRLDANGNLVLVARDSGDVKLPPLRLDDVVTIFRSVYIEGEGPTVTIDPDPQQPEGPAMVVRHGKATADTYVGWVLYQADRLMKGYSLGRDNLTQQDVTSRVPRYAQVLNSIFFGDVPGRREQGGVWQRFWIVPAATRRYRGSRRELDLFDVPLKVRTQRMRWQNGKLVDDTSGGSTPGALAFTSWFTDSYDGIAAEQYLTPPAESGLTAPVPVFTELRRIALMTAVAERLRDSGAPMPAWMRSYEVRPVPFEHTTPSLTVTREGAGGTVRIYGGVELSPETRAVRTYSGAQDAAAAPADLQGEVRRGLQTADQLEAAAAAAVPGVESQPLAVHHLTCADQGYTAVALPGSQTRALGPCRQTATDLALSLGGGQQLTLERDYSSFFDPAGPLGRGWTFDWPQLETVHIPLSRQGSEVKYSVGCDLFTPLGSVTARFQDGQPLDAATSPFQAAGLTRPSFLPGAEATVVQLKDGRRWYFASREGVGTAPLIAIEDGPRLTLFERDGDGAATALVARLGGAEVGRITLSYAQGRLVKAVGTAVGEPGRQRQVRYGYDAAGRLATVTGPDGVLRYDYQGALLTTISLTPEHGGQRQVLASFDYNANGQVTAEHRGGATIQHTVTASSTGAVAASASNGQTVSTRYDGSLRPVESLAADGTRTAWQYAADGGQRTTITSPDQTVATVEQSADGRTRRYTADGGPSVTAHFDLAGRLTAVSRGAQPLLTQTWRPDGQLQQVGTPTSDLALEYDEHSLLTALHLHPTGGDGRDGDWLTTQVDPLGNPTAIRDGAGLDLQMAYDAAGNLISAGQMTTTGLLGLTIERDGDGRPRAMRSPWGDSRYRYAGRGGLTAVDWRRGGATASVRLANGLVRQVAGFDGGVTHYDYHQRGPLAGRPRSVLCANGLRLSLNYDRQARLSDVEVGSTRRLRLSYDDQGRLVGYGWEAR